MVMKRVFVDNFPETPILEYDDGEPPNPADNPVDILEKIIKVTARGLGLEINQDSIDKMKQSAQHVGGG